MKLVEVRPDETGLADLDGTLHEVGLSLIEDAKVGEHVIVHAGYAIEKLDEKEAEERLKLFDELSAAYADSDDN